MSTLQNAIIASVAKGSRLLPYLLRQTKWVQSFECTLFIVQLRIRVHVVTLRKLLHILNIVTIFFYLQRIVYENRLFRPP